MLSISSRSFAPPGATVAALLPAARALGFTSVSISFHEPRLRRGATAEGRTATGVRIESLRSGGAELASLDEARRQQAVSDAVVDAAFAESLGCRTVVLEGGASEEPGLEERVRRLEGLVDRGEPSAELLEEIRLQARRRLDAQLDRLCRSIHAVARRMPELRFSLLPAVRPHQLLFSESLAAVLSDLKLPSVSVRIDVGESRAAEALGGEPLALLLPKFAARVTGLDLHDARGLRSHLPPGDGDVDWRLVADHL